MSDPNLDDDRTPSQGVVPSVPGLPVVGQPPVPLASYGSPPSVVQVPMSSIVSDSTSVGYFPYKDLLKFGSYQRQFHSVKPKTSGYMLHASAMQTTIEQIPAKPIYSLEKPLMEPPLVGSYFLKRFPAIQ